MSKGSFLLLLPCLLVLLQVCIAQLPLISNSHQLTGGQIPDGVLCQDPIRRTRWMSSRHAHDEFDDSISDEELTGDEYESNHGGVPMAGGQGLLPPDGDGDGGSSGGTKDSSGGDVQCPECGKFFKNDKSMFGHLRSHPNRGYKGATPPVKKMKLSPETAMTSSSSSLLGTNRLSPDHPQHSGRDPELTPLEKLCAYVMLTLKYSRDNKAPQQAPLPASPPPPSFVKLEAIGQAEGGTKAEGGTRGSSSTTAEFRCNDAGVEAGNMRNTDGLGDFVVKIPKKRRNMPTKGIREAHSRKKAKLVLTPKEKRPYACKHCKAEFPTNQALGGHVAGHHREKKALQRLNDHPGMASDQSQNNGRQRVKGGDYYVHDHLSLQRGLHSEQFPMALDVPWQSGMASGGQMRQHSERRNLGLSSAVESPTPVRTDVGDARRVLDLNIDLNVEAPEQE